MSDIWHRLPLPLKIALPVTLLCLLCSLAVVAVLQRNQQTVVEERLDALGDALVSRLAHAAASPLVANDPLALQGVATGFASEGAVQRAAIYDPARHLVAAAGSNEEPGWEYTQTIQWQDAAVGQAVLTLRPDAVGSELLHATDLVIVALIVSLLAGALALRTGARIDRLLGLLARRLAGEQIEIVWRGHDQLGRLLRTPAPPLLADEVVMREPTYWALLQLYCPAGAGAAADFCLRQAENVAQLYGGEATVNRGGGVLLRFPLGTGSEERFQAVCAAILLNEVTRGDGARLALSHLPRSEAADRWQEQAAIENAYRVAVALPDGRLALDALFADDAELTEKVRLERRGEAWALVTGLAAPYDTLLRRQCAALKLAA